MADNHNQDQNCCPEFQLSQWHDKTLHWENKYFIKGKVFTFMFMPVGFGRTMRRMIARMEKAGAGSPQWMCLSDHTSKWNMDVYLDVDKQVEGMENISITGDFYCRVYEGPYRDSKKWCDHFELSSKEKGLEIKKWYMWYVYCPSCAKKYGKNYTAIFGQLA